MANAVSATEDRRRIRWRMISIKFGHASSKPHILRNGIGCKLAFYDFEFDL